MNRKTVGLLVAVALTVPIFATSPARAGGQCAALVFMDLDKKIGLPLFGVERNVKFDLTALCYAGTEGYVGGRARGTIPAASCGGMRGKGTFNGRPFTFQLAGPVGTVGTGVDIASPRRVSGAMSLVPYPLESNSCHNKTAKRFTGVAVLKGL